MKTVYRLTFNLNNRIEFRDVLAFSIEEANYLLSVKIPSAKLIESGALKPEEEFNVCYINNVIHVDFKAKKRVA